MTSDGKMTLTILDSTGDTPLTWDASDPARCAEVRKIVADLKAAGYTFFLVDGSPADEVSAGKGTLLVRKLSADEIAPVPAEPEMLHSSETPAPPVRRRGRPPKVAPDAEQNVVAVRPIRGG